MPQTAEIAFEAIKTDYLTIAGLGTQERLTLDRAARHFGQVMQSSDTLLIIWHSRTGTARAMAEAAMEGAESGAILMQAEDVEPSHILSGGGYLFLCPENLASMSGMMKEMFDRCYYPVLGRIEGRPYATAIAAGSDGEGAQRQIDRIAKGWRLKRVADPLIINTSAQAPEEILAQKTVGLQELVKCRELGAGLAEGVRQGIF